VTFPPSQVFPFTQSHPFDSCPAKGPPPLRRSVGDPPCARDRSARQSDRNAGRYIWGTQQYPSFGKFLDLDDRNLRESVFTFLFFSSQNFFSLSCRLPWFDQDVNLRRSASPRCESFILATLVAPLAGQVFPTVEPPVRFLAFFCLIRVNVRPVAPPPFPSYRWSQPDDAGLEKSTTLLFPFGILSSPFFVVLGTNFFLPFFVEIVSPTRIIRVASPNVPSPTACTLNPYSINIVKRFLSPGTFSWQVPTPAGPLLESS